MTFPVADRRAAPADCGSCNWSPDAAHPNVPGAQWEYVTFVDPETWLCPGCGMPNVVTGAVRPPQAPEVAEVVILPPEVPMPPTADLAPAGEASDGAPVPVEPPSPAGTGAAQPAPDDSEISAAPLEVVTIRPPSGDPLADDMDHLTDALTLVGNTFERILDVIIPDLLEHGVDPFTLVNLDMAVITIEQTARSVGAELGTLILQGLSALMPDQEGQADPGGIIDGTES